MHKEKIIDIVDTIEQEVYEKRIVETYFEYKSKIEKSFTLVAGSIHGKIFSDKTFVNQIIEKAKAGVKFNFLTSRLIITESDDYVPKNHLLRLIELGRSIKAIRENINFYVFDHKRPQLHFSCIDKKITIAESFHHEGTSPEETIIFQGKPGLQEIVGEAIEAMFNRALRWEQVFRVPYTTPIELVKFNFEYRNGPSPFDKIKNLWNGVYKFVTVDTYRELSNLLEFEKNPPKQYELWRDNPRKWVEVASLDAIENYLCYSKENDFDSQWKLFINKKDEIRKELLLKNGNTDVYILVHNGKLIAYEPLLENLESVLREKHRYLLSKNPLLTQINQPVHYGHRLSN